MCTTTQHVSAANLCFTEASGHFDQFTAMFSILDFYQIIVVNMSVSVRLVL